jgi:hypothetical protein
MGDDDHPVVELAIFGGELKLGIACFLFDRLPGLNVNVGKAENNVKSKPYADAAIAYYCSSIFM